MRKSVRQQHRRHQHETTSGTSYLGTNVKYEERLKGSSKMIGIDHQIPSTDVHPHSFKVKNFESPNT